MIEWGENGLFICTHSKLIEWKRGRFISKDGCITHSIGEGDGIKKALVYM